METNDFKIMDVIEIFIFWVYLAFWGVTSRDFYDIHDIMAMFPHSFHLHCLKVDISAAGKACFFQRETMGNVKR